jgi:hypothetical protein
MRKLVGMSLMVVTLSLLFDVALAFPTDLTAMNRGAYKDTGVLGTSGGSSAPTANYFAGFLSDVPVVTGEYRNFFVFDLRNITKPIIAATLLLDDNFACDGAPCGFLGSEPSLTYNLFDVTTPFQALVNNTGGLVAFSDLGSGNVYGTYVATALDSLGTIGISLNSVAVTALNNKAGNFFAIGGAIANLTETETQGLFGGSGSSDSLNTQTQLELVTGQAIPAPSTLALLGSALASLAVLRRRRCHGRGARRK